ncbi:uncharacterized protein B0H18DRAFT_1013530 [Fomitopsis serialis]|uniref:uncharacterized protein n=1 Tax=Fomitopsis serialis TaxID=139415 RepID=UPI0020077F6C|nr:uncharacterized protein B0H18DRAFT_1013530 [Neoantrodia serialis]KAH9923823.1 hypothetical protein B0H18DRAFT_1013530 [Neoantrodia serialis]
MFSQSYPTLPSTTSTYFTPSTSLTGLYDAPLGSISQFSQSVATSEAGSPDMFKQNVQLALSQVSRVQALARSVLLATQHAYQAGNNPIQTAADMATLQQGLQLLAEVLRHSGVGALPLRPRDPLHVQQPEVEEEQLIAEMTVAVQALFEKRKRLEESAGVVASLLGATEKEGRR